MATTYITGDVKKLIGYETDWVEAYDPVEQGAIRRFYQAVMDDDPTYWDPASAAPRGTVEWWRRPSSRSMLSADRRGRPIPLSRVAGDPNFDGVTRDFGLGLPPVPVPLPRLLNGGNEVEVYRLARQGDRIRAKSKYVDIYQKEGKSGTLVFILVETVYATQEGATLLKSLQSHILR